MKLSLWPDTLYGRLVLILVAGMFAGQLFTSTIWFETHDNRALEIPARLFASRLADTVRLLERAPDDSTRREIIGALGDARYRLDWIDPPTSAAMASAPTVTGPLAMQTVSDLISGVIRRRLGETVEVRLIDAHLRDDSGHTGVWTLFNSRMPSGDFHVLLKLPQGRWLDVRANEGQAGMLTEPRRLVFDYLVRIYFLRLMAVLLLALIAVRLAVRPLKQLAEAAEALGRNMHRSPLRVSGLGEVRTAARSFNAMQAQLIEGMAVRTRFLSAVSHDLRSPLTRLRLRVEMLPDASWRDRLRGDLEEMEAMVRATLDAVQGVEITEARHEIDLDSMIDGLAEDAREAGHQVGVEGHALRPVSGYPRNLKRCLQNLVDNGIRYGSRVVVHVADLGHAVQVTVSDSGPGIPDETMLERVFEAYFKLDASKDIHGHDHDRNPGTGLGLTIARSIAAAHGATLILRNRAGTGLDAVLMLPREDSSIPNRFRRT
jgi:signal transduction histidine kinase